MSLSSTRQAGSWHALKQIISAAALAGLLAGICLTVLQRWQVTPLIHQAEVLEEHAKESHEHGQHAPAPANPSAEDHQHAHSHQASHQHASPVAENDVSVQQIAAQWMPAEGGERIFYTLLANVSLAVAFGLLLGSALYLRGGEPNWRSGLLWGVAGYLIFFVAPSIGLPPELPGTEAAPLAQRQLWWVSTAASTAAGLALLRFASTPLKIVGAVMLAVPFLAGVPKAPAAAEIVPAAMAQAFIVATAFANAIFWLVLGAATAQFNKIYRR